MISRRGFLGGLAAALAAPPIIRTPGLLMPVRPLRMASEHIGDDVQYWGVDFATEDSVVVCAQRFAVEFNEWRPIRGMSAELDAHWRRALDRLQADAFPRTKMTGVHAAVA